MLKSWPRVGGAVAALALVLSACTSAGGTGGTTGTAAGGASAGAEADAGTLSIGALIDTNTFDSRDLQLGHNYQYWQAVYDTLLWTDDEGEQQPNLATEWSYNEDSTVLSLTLRDDVTFTDGTPFDGDAVKANIEYLQGGTGQNVFQVANVQEVAVLSPTQVELRLSAPDPALLYHLSQVAGVMASPTAIAAGTLDDDPVGSGPYVLDPSTQRGTSYVFTRNPNYWNAEAYPYDEYVIQVMNDLTPRLNALKTGQIQAGHLSAATASEAEAGGIQVLRQPVDWIGFVIVDRDGTIVPELADVRVRQAMNYAIDREGLLQGVSLGFGTVSDQPFSEASEAYDPDLEGTYDYDVDKAKDLMQEAGVDGFEVTIPQAPSPYDAIYPIVADQLAEIGITVNYVQIPADQSIAEARSGKYAMFFFSLGSAQAWRDIRTWITPNAPWNVLKTQTPELDALLAAAQSAAPGDEQVEAYQAINRYTLENAWFDVFYKADNVFGVSPDVETTLPTHVVVPNLRSYRPAGN